MHRLTRGLFIVLLGSFLLVFISGHGRLIGHAEETIPEFSVESSIGLACEKSDSTFQIPEIRMNRAECVTSAAEQTNVPAVAFLTDSNGNILCGKQSYIRLMYYVFPLSDGFV